MHHLVMRKDFTKEAGLKINWKIEFQSRIGNHREERKLKANSETNNFFFWLERKMLEGLSRVPGETGGIKTTVVALYFHSYCGLWLKWSLLLNAPLHSIPPLPSIANLIFYFLRLLLTIPDLFWSTTALNMCYTI